MFHVDVTDYDSYTFYYNVEKLIKKGINEHVEQVIGKNLASKLPRNGGSDYAKMGSYNKATGQIEEIANHFEMMGITASVNKVLAEEILERAIFYCPKDTGELASSGRIEQLDDGSCRIFFDCGYAWYVHEFTWKNHNFPTCAKFLTRAIQEVETLHGFGWYEGK